MRFKSDSICGHFDSEYLMQVYVKSTIRMNARGIFGQFSISFVVYIVFFSFFKAILISSRVSRVGSFDSLSSSDRADTFYSYFVKKYYFIAVG